MFSCISDNEATVSLLLFSLKLIYLFIGQKTQIKKFCKMFTASLHFCNSQNLLLINLPSLIILRLGCMILLLLYMNFT